MFTAS